MHLKVITEAEFLLIWAPLFANSRHNAVYI